MPWIPAVEKHLKSLKRVVLFGPLINWEWEQGLVSVQNGVEFRWTSE